MDAVAGKDQWPDFLSPETGGGVSVDKSAPIEQEQERELYTEMLVCSRVLTE